MPFLVFTNTRLLKSNVEASDLCARLRLDVFVIDTKQETLCKRKGKHKEDVEKEDPTM
jgi:hypothetical protein